MWIKLFYVHVISRSVHPFAVGKMRQSPRSPCFGVSALIPVKQPCYEHLCYLPVIPLCVFQELFITLGLFTVGSSVPSISPFASQPCTTSFSTASSEHSERQWGADPSRHWHGQKLCFPSSQACKESVTRGCAGQMGFPFGCKGELSSKADLLWGIPWRVLAPTPAASSKVSTLTWLFCLVICTIWATGFEGIKKKLA